MTNPDGLLKSRDFTLSTKFLLVKAMGFTVVMYGCESWMIKKPMVLTRAGLASSQKLPTISLLVSIPLPSVQQREKHLPLEKYLLLH